MKVINLRRRHILLWQALLLIVGTSWLWSAFLNPYLSYRTTLISQYETPGEPYSWLLRAGDVLAGLLVITAASLIAKRKELRSEAWLILAIGAGMFLDPLLTTTCHTVGNSCKEYVSTDFVFHAVETVFTSSVFFIAAIYDSWKREKLVSIVFAVFQIVYGAMFVSQLASQDNFNTVSQYVYQTVLLVWLAWYCRDLIAGRYRTSQVEGGLVRNLAGGWAFINGVLAILISLAHISLFGRIKGLYFSGDSAWLAQHGIVVGVIMLYLARHLARGEARARQIFLVLAGSEAIKYSAVSPNSGLMFFYMLTFVALFLFKDDFDRGSLPLTWAVRLRDLYYMLAGLLISAFIALLALDRDNRVSLITFKAADNFYDYVFRGHQLPHRHLSSVLLANTASVFISVGAAAILWILFRPQKIGVTGRQDYRMIESALAKNSNSSEDYFKLWPPDKHYIWSKNKTGFVAYKLEGPVIFALADPISSARQKLVEDFGDWCRRRRLKVCWLPVYESRKELYEKAGLSLLQIGSSAVVDIHDYLENTSKDKWWRWRLNKSRKSGYEYNFALPPHDSSFLEELRRVSDAWLSSGGHKERGFALGYFDKNYLQKCKIHFLKDTQGKIIAFTNEVPRYGKVKTATIDLLRYFPETESMAFLLYSAIEHISQESSIKKFDLGFVPFTGAIGPLQAIAKAVSSDRFSAKGLEQFKNKFDPVWEPNYLAYEGDMADLAIIALNIEGVMEQ